MTGKKYSSRFAGMKALFGNETDALKTLMKEVLQEILSLVTQIGKLELRIPRDRNGEFSTALFERYQLDAHNRFTRILSESPSSSTTLDAVGKKAELQGPHTKSFSCSPASPGATKAIAPKKSAPQRINDRSIGRPDVSRRILSPPQKSRFFRRERLGKHTYSIEEIQRFAWEKLQKLSFDHHVPRHLRGTLLATVPLK